MGISWGYVILYWIWWLMDWIKRRYTGNHGFPGFPIRCWGVLGSPVNFALKQTIDTWLWKPWPSHSSMIYHSLKWVRCWNARQKVIQLHHNCCWSLDGSSVLILPWPHFSTGHLRNWCWTLWPWTFDFADAFALRSVLRFDHKRF